MKNSYKKIWEDLENKRNYPKFLRKFHIISFKEAKKLIYDINYGKKIIDNMLSGDVYIFKESVNRKKIIEIRNKVFDFGLTPSFNQTTTLNCSNYHQKIINIIKPKEGYSTINHSYYFFKWNEDELDLFKTISPAWKFIKLLAGIDENIVKTGIYPNGYVDRAHFLYYPLNKGLISTHMDFPMYQKMNMCISLSQKGVDYKTGGFYVFDNNKNKKYMDDMLEIGDCVCWYPPLYHGCDIPYNDKLNNKDILSWEENKGRWNLILNTPATHITTNRKTSKSIIKI